MAKRATWTIWRSVSASVLLAGLLLVALMIATEGELGALPLALVSAGALGFAASWRKPRGPKT